MKSSLKFLLSSLLIGLFCAPAFAFHFSHAMKNNHSIALFNFIVTTSDGRPFQAFVEQKEYVGRSTTQPCSDLTLYTNEKFEAEIEPVQTTVSSDDFVYYPGPGYSCFRGDMIIAGKTYSTGNIQVVWDSVNQAYVDANPKEVAIHFDSPAR
ncbi:MAG: hypothetical protein P4M14_00305 [Gammaproteobacteria bacterium]|nr:hypothetical protein [Gammaproteobacteria bacterium]